MPARRPKSIPKCFQCREVDLHEMDGHWHCLKCLSITHDPIDCEVCADLPKPVRDIRSLLITETVEQGSWPANWLERLKNIENIVSQRPLDVTSPKESKKPKSNEATKKPNTKKVVKQTKSKKVLSKEIISSSSSSSSETDEENENENQTEVKNGLSQIQTQPKQVDSVQSQGVIPGEDWQTSITSTVTTLAANMQAMMEKMNKMAQAQITPKTKSKKSKKSKSKHDSDVEPSKKRRKTNDSTPPSTSTYQTPPEQPSTYDYSLPEELMQPPLPSRPIPRFSDHETFHNVDLVYNSSEESDDTELEVDINRNDKRKLYLQGLKSLVPSLKHGKQDTQPESGHFSLITRAPNLNIMPMLDEVYTQVANTASKDSIINKSRKRILINTSKYYATTEPAESGFLQPRTIPRELLSHVHPNKLNKKGASGSSAALSKASKEGVKEIQALGSFKHAANSIRLANNMEIGIEAQGSLIKRCQRNINRIKEHEVPEEVQGLLGSLNTSLQLMNQTLFDLKSSNNDLMKMSLGQYNQSMTDRREAWLAATDLPIGMIQELRDADQTYSQISDHKGPLKMFNESDIQMLKDFNAAEKDIAIVRACNVRAQTNRGRGRGQQSRSRPFGRGATSAVGRGYEQQPSFQYNRPRGRGRAPRSRGQKQTFRGQAGQKQS